MYSPDDFETPEAFQRQDWVAAAPIWPVCSPWRLSNAKPGGFCEAIVSGTPSPINVVGSNNGSIQMRLETWNAPTGLVMPRRCASTGQDGKNSRQHHET